MLTADYQQSLNSEHQYYQQELQLQKHFHQHWKRQLQHHLGLILQIHHFQKHQNQKSLHPRYQTQHLMSYYRMWNQKHLNRHQWRQQQRQYLSHQIQ